MQSKSNTMTKQILPLEKKELNRLRLKYFTFISIFLLLSYGLYCLVERESRYISWNNKALYIYAFIFLFFLILVGIVTKKQLKIVRKKEKIRLIGYIDKKRKKANNDNRPIYFISIEGEEFMVKRAYYDKVKLGDFVQFDFLECLSTIFSLKIVEESTVINKKDSFSTKIKDQLFEVTSQDRTFLEKRFQKHREHYILVTSFLLFFILIALVAYYKNGQFEAVVFGFFLSFIFSMFVFFFIKRCITYLRNKAHDKKIGNSSIVIDKEVNDMNINSRYYILTTFSTCKIRVEKNVYDKLNINDKLIEFKQMKEKKVFSFTTEEQNTFYTTYSVFTNS